MEVKGGGNNTLCKAAVLSPFPSLAIKCWKSDPVFIKRNTLWMNTGCQMETEADKAKNSLDKVSMLQSEMFIILQLVPVSFKETKQFVYKLSDILPYK